jgi:hypothetical protein
MFSAALRSAFSLCPHATHWNSAWVLRLSDALCPQVAHVWLVKSAGTATNFTPRQAALYWSIERAIDQPFRSIARLSDDLARTFLPGASMVPAAEAVIAFTFRSSIAISA